MKTKTIPNDLQPKREGDKLLITTPHYWGKGATIAEAKAELSKAGGTVRGPWRVNSVHPDAYVCEDGMIHSKKGHAPIKVAEHNPS
jgi:hypothetical protein